MTRSPGQEQAVEQLREIERASNGALDLVRIVEPTETSEYLQAEVSVDCEGFPRAEGGLPLRTRERFIILVPEDFPFAYPSLWVPHTRFAGHAHVQWGFSLCVYQSPETEWDSSDGMYGFIDRLDTWLRHGALNELQPAGDPLHPPVAYRVAGVDTPLFIPRADTPPVGETAWIGLANLRVVSEKRVDITGWTELFADNAHGPFGAAVLLPGQLPWEFPSNGSTLIEQLEKHGVSRRLLLLTLGVASLHLEENEPLYVVIGSKMRGISGSDDLRQHLTVWRVEPLAAWALKTALPRSGESEDEQARRENILRIVSDWIASVQVQWCGVREDRPEVVTRRDVDTPMAWFRGKTVAVWGCGALGGAVAEALLRASVAALLLYDNGAVAPGLLARQPYEDGDVGENKARALHQRLRRVQPHGVEITAHAVNLLSGPLGSEDWTDGVDVVIDASASAAVLEKLELRRAKPEAPRVPVASMVIGPRAERGLVVVAGTDYSGGPADLSRRTKIATCARPELGHFADEFWPGEARHPVFQPEPGCSASTFVGSWADVSAMAMSMLNLVARDLAERANDQGTAHLLAQAYVDLAPPAPRQVDLVWERDVVLHDPHSAYEIRVAPSAWREMVGWVATSRRRVGPKPETGGVLFGERNEASRVIWVSEVIGPPPDSEASPDLFLCGVEGVAESNQEKRTRTRGSVQYIGMWHTHPVSQPVPSTTDFNGMARLVLAQELSSPKPLLLILGYTSRPRPWSTGAFVFSRRDFEQLLRGSLRRAVAVRRVDEPAFPTPAPSVGLALSGGGSRAIAFHLGCLRALHDRGILERLRVISAVSGGSVIGAAYAYSNDEFAEFERRIVKLLRHGLAGGIARRTFFSSNTPRALATVATAGLAAAGNSALRTALSMTGRARGKKVGGRLDRTGHMPPPLHRRFTRTHAFEATLRDVLFGDISLRDPRRRDVDVVINASELRTGTAFRFGSRESGAWRFGAVQGNDVAVAHAVAASAAYPVFLPAFDETLTFERRDGSVRQERVVLSDGGVVENLGVSCMEPGRGDVSFNTYTPDYIFACDAGTGQFGGHQVPYGWPSRMTRAFETVFRKAHDATLSRLHTYVPAGQLRGFMLAYLGQQDGSLPAPPPDLVPQEDVMAYPTDFSAMPREAIEQLSKRGEQLTRLLIARYCPDL
jgi:integrative and conjugative element protein (TIGR02256 family)